MFLQCVTIDPGYCYNSTFSSSPGTPLIVRIYSQFQKSVLPAHFRYGWQHVNKSMQTTNLPKTRRCCAAVGYFSHTKLGKYGYLSQITSFAFPKMRKMCLKMLLREIHDPGVTECFHITLWMANLPY